MPADSGMAFVLVQHLAPDHKSILTELLGKVSPMRVVEAQDGMPVDADRVFVIAPDSTLAIKDRRLQVSRPAPPRDRRRPIDTFFSSLAEDQGDNAVCIVLAGTGSDGSLGLKAIKEHGGLTLAQAEVDHIAMGGMPHNAAITGLVDHVLRVEEMPAKLLEYKDHLFRVADRKDGDGTRTDTAEHLATISALLFAKTGHDFSRYKDKTVSRRIQRRMQVLQTDTVPAYMAGLREDPQEIELLFRELLIGVTQFFRNPEAFEVLRTSVIDKLFEQKVRDRPIRVWVPGCSTGEEAYSIAILLGEASEERGIAPEVHIFATDIDDRAVEFARAARFKKPIGLSPERVARWFVEDNDEHNVIKDPPFSRLDLISCRNLLIYMNRDLQDRVLRAFHYALTPGAALFLGPSESINQHPQLFASLDRTHRIFRRHGADAAFPGLRLAESVRPPAPPSATPAPASSANEWMDRSTRRALAKYSPVYLVVDKNNTIVRFSGGEVSRYLEPSPGAANLSLFGNLRRTLRPMVRDALRAAQDANGPIVNDDVWITIDKRRHSVTVIVEPILDGQEEGFYIVAFLERTWTASDGNALAPGDAERPDLRASEHELRTTRAQLQSTIDDLDTANEELRSTSEEHQAVNEELQSSNEELETSKEEMQSINEELETVNAELTAKNTLLTNLNSDIRNLLESTQIATIFLDSDLRIKSYTPGMMDIFHLRDSDVGRPVTEIVSVIAYDDLRRDVDAVLREFTVVERDVELQGVDRAFTMRMRPYRSVENVVDGVVITFVDITERRRTTAALRESEGRFSAIVYQTTVGVAETDLQGRFSLTNARFCDIVGRSADELLNLRTEDVTHPDDVQRYVELFDRLVSDGTAFEIEKRYLRPDGSVIWVHNSVSALVDQSGRPTHGLVVTLEIGERKKAEQQTALLLSELDHRVKNILAIVASVVSQTLKTSLTPAAFAAAIDRRIAAIARAHSMLNNQGDGGQTSLQDLVTTELEPYNRNDYNISVDGVAVALTPRAGLSLALAIHELASNAAKYGALSIPSGRLTVSWTVDHASPRLLSFVWAESGGPPIEAPPAQRGFGTTLIERTLTHEFDAEVHRDFRRSGLRCTIKLPLTAEVGEIDPPGVGEGGKQ
jgi:two-component system CheB/CheR fusion protein